MSSKVIYLTGISGGLGTAIASCLLNNGYVVVGLGRSKPKDNFVINHENFNFFPFDVSILNEIKSKVNEVVKKYGVPYALINNAALGGDGVLATQHESDISKILDTNLHAPILLSKYLGRYMFLKKTGRIVNVSSVVATTGYSGLAVYAATKSGLLGFTRSLSREYGKMGITVNSVSPGFMETKMTEGIEEDKMNKIKKRSPGNQLPQVDHVAQFVNFLVSEAGESMNGSNTILDCGNSA